MVGLSSWVWSFLDDASDGGFSPREETLTEILLVEMRRHAKGEVAIDKAIGLEESKYGADFAWAIRLRSGKWLTLLVQAKKLNPATGTFKELKDGQLGRLQARATSSGSLAVYLFYSDSALGEAGDHLAFGRCSRPISVIREHFGPPWTTRLTPAGCTLALAADVKRLSGRGVPKATPVEIAKVGCRGSVSFVPTAHPPIRLVRSLRGRNLKYLKGSCSPIRPGLRRNHLRGLPSSLRAPRQRTIRAGRLPPITWSLTPTTRSIDPPVRRGVGTPRAASRRSRSKPPRKNQGVFRTCGWSRRFRQGRNSVEAPRRSDRRRQ
jgi:hypothetical protein